MATTTPNLGLTKPSYDDAIDIQVLNDNSDIIDGAVGTLQANDTKRSKDIGQVLALTTSDQSSLVGAINEVKRTADKVEELGVSVTAFGAKGDGITDDTAAFVAALANSSAVIVPKGGVYLVGNVEVIGKLLQGRGTIKKRSDAECALHIKGNGSVIKDIMFEAEPTSGQPNADIKLGEGATNVRIEGCHFNSQLYSAIAGSVDTGVGGTVYATPVSGVTIINNVFDGEGVINGAFIGYVRPLFLHSINNITISNNIIRNCSYDAIRLRENDGFVLITDNQFINAGDANDTDGLTNQTRDAIDVYWSGANLSILNNMVRGTGAHGFDVKGFAPDGSYGTSKVVIAGNQIYQARRCGIVVFGDTNYDGNGNYKFMHGVIITNNIIQECNQSNISGTGDLAEAGIRLRDLVAYTVVSENVVAFNYGRGIYVHNATTGKAKSHSIRVAGNQVFNNGVNGQTTAGILVAAVDSVVISENICENDTTLANANQNIGIQTNSQDNGYTATKSAILKNNICRNNLLYQITTEPSNNRADCIAVFDGNLQEGTNANFRGAWQHQRSTFFGSAAPSASEGTFRQGDIIFNTAPSNGGISHWVCTATGNPGTWSPVQVGALTSISATPSYVGQRAVVGGVGYMAVGVASTADWKQITN